MNFEYSDEQRLLSDTLRKFLGTGYSFDARGKIIASPAGFSDDVWAALAEMGILSVPFDAVYGGFGGTTIDMLIVFEAFGEALGRYYSEEFGLSVICLRIGTCNRVDRPEDAREFATLLSGKLLRIWTPSLKPVPDSGSASGVGSKKIRMKLLGAWAGASWTSRSACS